ncbi:MAG TPA: phospho-sugar mutase [Clostridia bacterium]|nr:phospho-sugar mutase [Clostridia bacterium]
MNYIDKYNSWLSEEIFDDHTKKELESIKENKKEIEDRFYKDLEFGTAGLRGIIGAGTNRLNRYTVTKATQGLANYIIKQGGQEKGVVIAFDSRHMSPEFSKWAALCLNANGIKTYRFNTLRPTPELSFAIRELGCIAGIVITASHNPPEYNGYKAYWEDGAQIVSPRDKEIIEEVKKVETYSEIKTISLQEAVNNGLYNTVGKDIDDRYIEELKKLVLNPDIVKEHGKDLKIVYTPLHGSGNTAVQRILNELGFENVYIVKEQELPDGNFPTVSYPNPEDPKAFELALELAKKVDADIILATDPDADRLGVYSKDKKNGEYVSYTGNMSALLIAEYEISQMKEKGILPENGVLISTIVSSELAKAIAAWYDLESIEVLTGFKYIGEKIKLFEQNNEKKYVFGFEESYGCLVGTHARDKDAIVAVMALCEAAAFYKSKGLTLLDQMNEMYKKYGYYKEAQVSITLKGIEGEEKIKKILNDFRKNPPKKIGKYNVIAIRDYENGIINYENGKEKNTNLPKSNVLYYELEDNAWCCVRPSGTEPKIKFYIGVKEDSNEKAEQELEKIKDEMLELS